MKSDLSLQKKNENSLFVTTAQEGNLLTPPRQYYVGRVYLLVDAVSSLAKQVKKRTKKEGNARVKPAVTSKKGHHQEWTLRHNNIVAAMRGIGSDVHINIQMKCVIYIPMTLLVMGEVPHQRLYVGKATTTTQQGTTHCGAY